MNSDCKVVNMKIFHMHGSNDAKTKFIPFIIDKIKSNTEVIELTEGLQTRDFVYVKDVVSAFKFILQIFDTLSSFQEFEIGSGTSHSIKKNG